jgi:hypothetical protein
MISNVTTTDWLAVTYVARRRRGASWTVVGGIKSQVETEIADNLTVAPVWTEPGPARSMKSRACLVSARELRTSWMSWWDEATDRA